MSELSFGAAFVTSGQEGYTGAKPLLREALAAGINLIDTSADYGDSEAAIGEAPGAKNLSQLHQNLKACQDGPLAQEIVGKIDEIAAVVPFRPFEEPFLCPFYDSRFDLGKRPGPAVLFER